MMTDNVTRYTLVSNRSGDVMVPDEAGEWVRANDYTTLTHEIDALAKQFDVLRASKTHQFSFVDGSGNQIIDKPAFADLGAPQYNQKKPDPINTVLKEFTREVSLREHEEQKRAASSLNYTTAYTVVDTRRMAHDLLRLRKEMVKAVDALISITNNTCCGNCQEASRVARQALARQDLGDSQ